MYWWSEANFSRISFNKSASRDLPDSRKCPASFTGLHNIAFLPLPTDVYCGQNSLRFHYIILKINWNLRPPIHSVPLFYLMYSNPGTVACYVGYLVATCVLPQRNSTQLLRVYIQVQILCVWFMPLLYGLILDLHVFAFSISQYCACCMSQAPGWRNHHEVGVVWLICSRSFHAFFVLGPGYTRDWLPTCSFV
jgi:hypothetical protein